MHAGGACSLDRATVPSRKHGVITAPVTPPHLSWRYLNSAHFLQDMPSSSFTCLLLFPQRKCLIKLLQRGPSKSVHLLLAIDRFETASSSGKSLPLELDRCFSSNKSRGSRAVLGSATTSSSVKMPAVEMDKSRMEVVGDTKVCSASPGTLS